MQKPFGLARFCWGLEIQGHFEEFPPSHTQSFCHLTAQQELDDDEEVDFPGDAADQEHENEEDGGLNGEGEEATDDIPTDSVPTTDLDDAEDPGNDDGHDSDVEIVDLDPYRHQPDNQLGLDDYESPRNVSEEPAFTPEREEPKVTPRLRKATHLDPEHFRGDESDEPSSSSARSGAIDIDKIILLFSLNVTMLGRSGPCMLSDILCHLICAGCRCLCGIWTWDTSYHGRAREAEDHMCTPDRSDQYIASVLWSFDTFTGVNTYAKKRMQRRNKAGMWDGTRAVWEKNLLSCDPFNP